MKRIILILFMLFAFINSFAFEKTFVILVDVDELLVNYTWNQVKDKLQGLKTISEAGGQPFRMTRVLTTPNTNYKLIKLSFKDTIERDYFIQLRDEGILKLIRKYSVKTEYNSWKGGDITSAVTEEINDFPADYYTVWPSTY